MRILEPAEGLRCAVADNASPMTLDGTRNYLVGRRAAVLLDPGPGGGGQAERVRRLVGERRVAAVALTHAHPDHAGGARQVAGELGVPLVASPETLARLEIGGRDIDDGERLELDGGAAGLRAVATPGHAGDHLSYLWDPPRAVFTGDLVLGRGSAMVGHPDGHMGDYLASLDRLAALEPTRLYPGHGDPVDDAAGTLEAYRRHRLEREERVRRAVEDGARSVVEIRRRAYDEVPEGLARAADASVRAHVVHLRETGVETGEIEGFEDGDGPPH